MTPPAFDAPSPGVFSPSLNVRTLTVYAVRVVAALLGLAVNLAGIARSGQHLATVQRRVARFGDLISG
jgi:hypothetical protein